MIIYEITDDSTNGKGTVKVVGFAKGKSASTVKFASSVKFKEYSYQVTAVGDKAFYKNTKIKQINMGGNIKIIGKRAFYGCTKLTSAVLGNKVTQLSDFALYKCTSLNKVTIGTSLNTIGSHVFCHDKKLRSIDIKSKNIKKVGKHNMYKCTNMNIKVPSSKVKAYTKLFKNQGQKSSVKVVK